MTYYDLPQDLQDMYAWLDDDAKNYPVEWVDGVIRFKRNKCVDWCASRGILNDMWMAARKEQWPKKDIQFFYRQIGYSLSGYGDITGWDNLP